MMHRHVVVLTLLTAIAFGYSPEERQNLQLKRTNSALLRTLKALTAEMNVGSVDSSFGRCLDSSYCPDGEFCAKSADEWGQSYCTPVGTSAELPAVLPFKIAPDQIRTVIGKGGSQVKRINERFQVLIYIKEDGEITIKSHSEAQNLQAKKYIENLTTPIEVGTTYSGIVSRLEGFGAYVKLHDNKEGLVHISQISEDHVTKVSDYLQEGQEVNVRVMEIDKDSRIRLTMKDVPQPENA